MFYCEACQGLRRLSKSVTKSYGKCELCGGKGACYDGPLPIEAAPVATPQSKRIPEGHHRQPSSSESIPRWRTEDEHVAKKLAGYEAAIETLEGEVTALRNELTAAHQRIENIIEVAGHLQPADVRIVAPPHLEDPRPEEWEIEARVSQRNREVERVEKVIGLCLEKHFGLLRERISGLEAENERLRSKLLARPKHLMRPPVISFFGFQMESADI